MNSTFLITLKCLAFSAIVAGGCMIAETIDFNIDFSGTRTIEFPYAEKDGSYYFNDPEMDGAKWPEILEVTKQAFAEVGNVSNLVIDTSNQEMATIKYDFGSGGAVILDSTAFLKHVNRLPHTFSWYLKQRPNQIKVINENEIIWNKFPKNLIKMHSEGQKNISENYSDVDVQTILNFSREIQSVDDSSVEILNGGKRISTTFKSNLLFEGKEKNEVLITFKK